MMCSLPGVPRFGLPSLPGAQAEDRQVVGHFRARRGDPTAQSRPHGIKPLVELHWEDVGRTVVGIDAEPLPFGLDRIVVQRIVKRQLVEVLTRIGEGELGLENHLVRYSVDVEQLAFDRGIDGPDRQTRPHAGLPVGPVQGVARRGPGPNGPIRPRRKARLLPRPTGTASRFPAAWKISRRIAPGQVPPSRRGHVFPRQIIERLVVRIGRRIGRAGTGQTPPCCARTR